MISMVEALVLGLVTVLLVYGVGQFAVTRLGREVLLDGGRASKTYTVLDCVVWLAASLAATYLSSRVAPPAQHAPILLPAVIAAVSGLIVLRNVFVLRWQQSFAATAAIFLMIAAGTYGGLVLRHAI